MMFPISLWFFFPGLLLGAFVQQRQRGEKADPYASLSVLLETYSGERRRTHTQALGKHTRTYRVWEIFNECKDIPGSHYIVFKAWSANVLDCCSRAIRIIVVFPEGFQHLHLHTFTCTSLCGHYASG